jgi:hypothetical protein
MLPSNHVMTFPVPESPLRLAFIDEGLPEDQLLAAALSPGTRIHGLDPAVDALSQTSQELAHQHELESVAIFSHGSEGRLQLGGLRLDSQALAANADAIQAWSTALAPGADLLLYGCNVAAHALGRAFLLGLPALTGADVAGSDGLTGIAAEGGNRTQEVRTGPIETADLLDSQLASTFDHLLGPRERSDALVDLLLNFVRSAGFDQVRDFGPIEDFFPPGGAPRIATPPNVDVAEIEIDRQGEIKAVADVLLSRDYPTGLKVPINSNYGTELVRWLRWDIHAGTAARSGCRKEHADNGRPRAGQRTRTSPPMMTSFCLPAMSPTPSCLLPSHRCSRSWPPTTS